MGRAEVCGVLMLRLLLIVGALALLILGCSNRVSLRYDASVSSNEQSYLNGDLGKLSGLSIQNNPNSNEASLMDLPQFTTSNLNNWLGQHTLYIVGENFDSNSALTQVASGIAYTPVLFQELGFAPPSTREARYLDATLPTRLADSGSVQTVMMNLGSAIYLQGKQNSTIYSMTVAGASIVVNTPRVNIEQIGPGLFDAKSLQGSPLDSLANSCLRLSTVFHEGQHTMGNSANAGFPHAQCNSGSYAGYYACENNLNGPYVIGRVFLSQCYYACTSCSPAELDGLTTFIADLVSRVLPGAQMSDDRPEEENWQ